MRLVLLLALLALSACEPGPPFNCDGPPAFCDFRWTSPSQLPMPPD